MWRQTYGSGDTKGNVLVLQNNSSLCLFRLRWNAVLREKKRKMCRPPRKGKRTSVHNTMQVAVLYQIFLSGFFCVTSELIIIWHSLFATFCLYRRDRASGCEVVISPHLKTGERKNKRLLLSVSLPLPLYLSYSTLILTFGFFLWQLSVTRSAAPGC